MSYGGNYNSREGAYDATPKDNDAEVRAKLREIRAVEPSDFNAMLALRAKIDRGEASKVEHDVWEILDNSHREAAHVASGGNQRDREEKQRRFEARINEEKYGRNHGRR